MNQGRKNFSDYNCSAYKDFSISREKKTIIERIKSPLRAASQKMYLYDILSGDTSEGVKIQANNLLTKLHNAKGAYEKDAIMGNIDEFFRSN